MRRDMLPHIRQSNLIEGIDDEAEDLQSLNAWYMLRNHSELTHNVICAVQRLITRNQKNLTKHQKGYYRSMSKINVTVGGHVPPPWSMVDGMMDNWLLDYDYCIPWEGHKRFEYIHPFVDGNGRTGRMLMWWHELRNGEEPTLFEVANRQQYYADLGAKKAMTDDEWDSEQW